MPKLWIDLEDLFEYAAHNARPSGIQRLQFELCHALAALDQSGSSVRFVRHDRLRQSFYTVPWSSADAVFGELSSGFRVQRSRALEPAELTRQRSRWRRGASRLVYNLSPDMRLALFELLTQQRAYSRALRQFLRVTLGSTLRARTRSGANATPGDIQPATGQFEAVPARDDVLLSLGAPWFHPDYARLVQQVKAAQGLRFAVLICDLIPVRRPEWCDAALVRSFARWLDTLLPLADTVFTISRASADDIVRYAEEKQLVLRSHPVVLPLGTGFPNGAPAPHRAEVASRLPAPRTYALVVGTVEPRKNHALLLRVWRRLLNDLPAEKVPTLVIAGRVGWLVADLMQQLRNAAFLGGKVLLIEDPTDQELAALYDGCLFTLFASFHEGWGLPVTESLAHGRPCISSNATALPEAGGQLARYFDPDNATEAYRQLRVAIDDPLALQAWAAEISRTYRPISWADSASAVLETLGDQSL